MGEKIDDICDQVTKHFTAQISELSNSEVEYVLDQLIEKFEGWREQAREAAMKDTES